MLSVIDEYDLVLYVVGLMQSGISEFIKNAIALDKASFPVSAIFPSEMVLEACLTLKGLSVHGEYISLALQTSLILD